MFLCNSSLISTKEYLLLRHIKIVRKKYKWICILPSMKWSGEQRVLCRKLVEPLSSCLWRRAGHNKDCMLLYFVWTIRDSGIFLRVYLCWVPYKVKKFSQNQLSWKYYATIIVSQSNYTLGYSNLFSSIGWLTVCDVATLTVWSCSLFDLGKLILV